MKFSQVLAQRFSLIVTPVVTSCCVTTTPTLAATLATSEAWVNLDNFSHAPVDIFTLTDTQTLAIARNSQAVANANADANFVTDPLGTMTKANNNSLSTAQGEGNSYFALAESNAAVIGYNFMLEEDETFFFDFNAFLGLKSSIDDPEFERSNAKAEIALNLYDTTDADNWQLLDFLIIAGQLTTAGNGDFLSDDKSTGLTYFPRHTTFETAFTGNQEMAEASVKGELSRTFNSLTYLTLVEAKTNRVMVKTVSESSTLLALLVFCLIGVGWGIKNKLS
ncbi:hypothetical protein [Coleofasciculus sp. E1-EBD-02]|jgi:hypothetical protein|uniref:hypothetical protein n=1 Tax=Coleofasciculus sp. E1-EBD-02 TaxID=3068481 RepID=UPI0032FDA31E